MRSQYLNFRSRQGIFNLAAALLLTIVLTLGFTPAAKAQTTTCTSCTTIQTFDLSRFFQGKIDLANWNVGAATGTFGPGGVGTSEAVVNAFGSAAGKLFANGGLTGPCTTDCLGNAVQGEVSNIVEAGALATHKVTQSDGVRDAIATAGINTAASGMIRGEWTSGPAPMTTTATAAPITP